MLDELRRWEEYVLNYWKDKGIYEKAKERAKGSLFRFLDGPPYPTGPIHIGTSWNKIMKDVILRFRRMMGYKVIDNPGYDMHGLPIEVQVEKKLGFRRKSDIMNFGVDKFIEECKKLAYANSEIQTRQFMRLGVWMNWSRTYYTAENSYVEGVWWAIKRMHELGRLYRGWKVLGWCARCQTVLAQHEYEYKIKTSPSLYFKVRLKDEEDTYIIVWTTTPWTIIGNMAIALNPVEDYVKVRVGHEVWILSKYQYEQGLLKELEVGEYRVLETIKGSQLDGVRYVHPLLEEVPVHKKLEEEYQRCHTVIMSEEYVRVEEGTGCLHVAPSFGPEDYDLGRRYSLPMLQFVDEEGKFMEEGGYFKGMITDEASREVLRILDEKGLLIKAGTIQHEYPHCWRCKTPLIFRLTRQWFFKVSDLRSLLVEEAKKTEWVPSWAKNMFLEWLNNIEDWCISRQRFWGTPLPIWVCEKCGDYLVVGSIEELEKLSGTSITDVHRPSIDMVTIRCRRCGGTMRRVPDVIDVWVDSGSATWAVLPKVMGIKDFSKWDTLDFIIEGKDQIRGWFSALFVLAVTLFRKIPFKIVYMHGFITDEKGRAMHKSLGNVIYPEEVVEKYCAEALRLYQVSSTSPGEDQRFGFELLKPAITSLLVAINTYNFLKQLSLYVKPKAENLRPEDRWLLSRVNTLTEELTSHLLSYELPEYARKLYEFIVEDVSHFYIQLIRDRVKDVEESGKVLHTLTYVLEKVNRLMAPLNPMLAEKLYLDVIRPLTGDATESIHLKEWPKVDKELVDKDLESLIEKAREVIKVVKRIRQEQGIKIRWPCIAVYVDHEELKPLADLLTRACNVKKVYFTSPPAAPSVKVSETAFCKVGLDVSETLELRAERLVRDLSRHIRATRKKMKLRPIDLIKVVVACSEEHEKLLRIAMDELKRRAGASEVIIVRELKMEEKSGEVEFEGRRIAYRVIKG